VNSIPTISILFGTVDRPQSTLNLIESIVRFTPPIKYKIIIVDGSTKKNGILQFAIDNPKIPICYYQEIKAQGYTKAYNIGAKFAEGKYLIWLNDDCLVLPEWATKIVNFMDNNPNIGVGGIPFNENNQFNIQQHVCKRYVANFGCSPVALWQLLNGFDEMYHSYGAEHDFCFKVLDIGYSVVPIPNVYIEHFRIRDEHHINVLEPHRAGNYRILMQKWKKRLL